MDVKKGLWLTIKSVWIIIRSYVALIMIVTIYFLPTGVALLKGRTNTLAIFVLNIFSIALIPWVVAFVWALSTDKNKIIVEYKEK